MELTMEYRVASIFKHNGFGATVISKLIKMGLKKNLYYEIKDMTVEERQDGVHAYKQKIRTKVYGLNSTKQIRQLLIDILIERVENHKDKIISPIIYNELLGMEIKRNGKVEHSASTHDDQIFSMLMALYMWYEGINMAERFGLKKVTIRTDDEVDEQLDYYNDDTVEIVDSFNTNDELDEEINNTLGQMIKAGGVTMQEFVEQRRMEEQEKFNQLVHTTLGERAYKQTYGIPKDKSINNYVNGGEIVDIPDAVFRSFYNPTDKSFRNYGDNIPGQTAVPAEQSFMLEDEDYNYQDHFNF
jgi:hypothetical protein